LAAATEGHYGLKGRVSSVQHAAVVLGVKTLLQIVTLLGNSNRKWTVHNFFEIIFRKGQFKRVCNDFRLRQRQLNGWYPGKYV
jgi:hypothetical protein